MFCIIYIFTDISFALFFLAVYVSNFNLKISEAWSINALPSAYICERCGKIYKRKSSLRNHVRDECGREPRFHCYICPYRTHQKGNLLRHLTVCHKGTAVPLQAWSGPEDSRKLRFPDFMTTAQYGGKVVSLTHWPPLPPGNIPGTHFC